MAFFKDSKEQEDYAYRNCVDCKHRIPLSKLPTVCCPIMKAHYEWNDPTVSDDITSAILNILIPRVNGENSPCPMKLRKDPWE